MADAPDLQRGRQHRADRPRDRGAVAAPPPATWSVVVDDSSPDGTGEVADRLAEEIPEVCVLHRTTKDGLGRAYLAGFQYAVDQGQDRRRHGRRLPHDPAYLPALLEATGSSDIVIGSVRRGGQIADWPPLRRMLSRGGSLYARSILGVHVRDLTGGFKFIRREVLETMDLGSLRAQGYVFNIELTYRALVLGFDVTEIPIVFRDRKEATARCPSPSRSRRSSSSRGRAAAIRGRSPRGAEGPAASRPEAVVRCSTCGCGVAREPSTASPRHRWPGGEDHGREAHERVAAADDEQQDVGDRHRGQDEQRKRWWPSASRYCGRGTSRRGRSWPGRGRRGASAASVYSGRRPARGRLGDEREDRQRGDGQRADHDQRAQQTLAAAGRRRPGAWPPARGRSRPRWRPRRRPWPRRRPPRRRPPSPSKWCLATITSTFCRTGDEVRLTGAQATRNSSRSDSRASSCGGGPRRRRVTQASARMTAMNVSGVPR